jgi:hypothetical protein
VPLGEFVDCWRRYRRADFHFEALQKQWREFVEAEPYSASAHIDDDGTGQVFVAVDYDPLPEAFSLELGEMLYQLRAALDHCIYAIAVRETGQTPPPDHDQLEFPITRSPEDFARAQRKIAPLSDEFRPVIEHVQPYNAGTTTGDRRDLCDAMHVLHEWARIDRHRRLHLLGSWVSDARPTLRLPSGVRVTQMRVASDGFLRADEPIATFSLSGWRPGMEFAVDAGVQISIGVNEPPYPTDEAGIFPKRATAIFAAVKSLIGVFEKGLEKEMHAPG